jgi:hypothetical protein
MSYDTDSASRYRSHAAKLRSIAASYDDEETITILIGVAREYDRMAEVFDISDSKNVVYLRA